MPSESPSSRGTLPSLQQLTCLSSRIRITGSGTNMGQNFVSFPGAYTANHAGIKVNIYDNAGNPNGGGRPYQIPGPSVFAC